jgi:hypothetical protein
MTDSNGLEIQHLRLFANIVSLRQDAGCPNSEKQQGRLKQDTVAQTTRKHFRMTDATKDTTARIRTYARDDNRSNLF